MFHKIKNHRYFILVNQMVRHSMVGGTNALLVLGGFYFLNKVLLLHYLVANILIGIISFFFVFFLQKKFTFKNKSNNHKKLMSYFLLFILSYTVLDNILMVIFSGIILIDPMIAKILNIGLLFIYSFIIQKCFVFKPEN